MQSAARGYNINNSELIQFYLNINSLSSWAAYRLVLRHYYFPDDIRSSRSGISPRKYNEKTLNCKKIKKNYFWIGENKNRNNIFEPPLFYTKNTNFTNRSDNWFFLMWKLRKFSFVLNIFYFLLKKKLIILFCIIMSTTQTLYWS